jgi:peptidyl-prolyl cis-trans isomerase D
MTLDEAATTLGLPVNQQTMTEIFPFLTGVGQVADGLDWAFKEASPGDVSPVFEDQQAFYMMELVSATPEGFQTLENARQTIDRILRMEKKVEMARSEARELVVEAREAGTLEVLDGRDGLTAQEVGPLTRNDFFPGLGYQGKPVGTAFRLDVDEISDPVVTESNVFLLQTLEKIPADSVAWEEQKGTQRARLSATLQQQRLEQWILGMKEAADIVDRREAVFQTSQSQSQVPTGSLF